MENNYDIIIIGSGVVGLATAYSLSNTKKNVLVVEEEPTFGRGLSSRSSEVIHSGIYYPENSNKQLLCQRGRNLLYDFCKKHKVWYNKCGKLIIAQKNELHYLEKLFDQSKKNDIKNVYEIDRNKIQSTNNFISAHAGLKLLCTGIISSHEFMNKLYDISVNSDHDYLFKSSIIDATQTPSGYELVIKNPINEIETVTAETIINCAGLKSSVVSQFINGPKYDTPNIKLSKGCYFKLSSKWKNKFNTLIYPVPDEKTQSLGIHLTIDRDKNARLGPDAKLIQNENYTISKDLIEEFYLAAKRYIPFINREDLTPDYAGIRPKIQSTDSKFNDFYINDEKSKGFSGWFNLIGIESPGLTSSLAIGEKIVKMI